MASPAARIRAVSAGAGGARLPAERGQAPHRPQVCAEPARPVRLGGPARTRPAENDAPSDLREVPGTTCLHPETDKQRVLPVYLRD